MTRLDPRKQAWQCKPLLLTLLVLTLAACGGSSDDSKSSLPGEQPAPLLTAPAITVQPVAAAVTAPATASFTVAASGSTPLAYQWRSSNDGTTWTDIAGATSSIYATGATDVGMSGRFYSVIVSNGAGSVTSAAVQVTIAAAPPSGGNPPSDGPLLPLAGSGDPFPQVAAPLTATPTIGGVSPDHRNLLTWDPSSSGQYVLGFLHYSGVETRLYVPVGAFLDDAWITTAEVTSIGASVTSVIAALDIEPGDYVAERTITANFMIPDAMLATVNPAQLIGFAADSDGSNLHMVPIVVGNFGASLSRPAIKLDHLGIVGIAVATPEQQAALAAAWPNDAGDQLSAALAPPLTAQWRTAVAPASVSIAKVALAGHKQIAAASGDDPAITALRGFYNDVVVPAFAAADADPSVAPAAINAGFSFLRQAELSGQAGTDGAFAVVAQQVAARINSLLDQYADYVAGQCRAVGGAGQMQTMLGTMRQLQLLGHQSKSDELEGILPQCSTFKIDFRYEYTHTGHWVEGYSCGPGCSGNETLEEDAHAVVKGSQTLSLGNPAQNPTLQLTTLDWNRTRTRDVGGVTRYSWASENNTPLWQIFNFSVPVIRTRGGTPSTAITLFLPAFVDIGPNAGLIYRPFAATVTSVYTSEDGVVSQPIVSPNTAVQLPIFVPTLPADGQFHFGPMLIPGSGNASSHASRVLPLNGGAMNEDETVTVTVSRAE